MTEADLYSEYRGVFVSSVVNPPEALRRFEQLTFRPDDVVIATYQKSGTTWMQEMVCLIMGRGDPQSVESMPNWLRVPWLETRHNNLLEDRPSPRLLATHLPYHTMPRALLQGQPKVIYVMRNPKDVCTSHYHFHVMASFLVTPSSRSDFIHKFLDGTMLYGSWFDHVKGWLRAAESLPVLYISYEEMTEDLRGAVRRVSEFLDQRLEEDVIERVVDRCRFNNMKKNDMSNYSQAPPDVLDHTKGTFMRKGVVGDWKNFMTVADAERFDAVYEEKMKGVDLQSFFKKEEK